MSLSKASQVCKRWNPLTKEEAAQVRSVNLHIFEKLRSPQIAQKIFEKMGKFLQKVNFGKLKFSEEFTVTKLLEILPKEKIRKLDFSGVATKKYVDDAVVIHISKLFPNLESLNLFGCWQVTDQSLIELCKCSNLRSLNVGSCYKISDAGIFEVSNLKYLEKLNLWRCKLLTDKSLEKLGNDCVNIKVLTISECEYLTNIGVSFFHTKCKIYF